MWPVLLASLRPTSPWLPWRAAPRSSFLTGRRRTMKPQVGLWLRLHPETPPPLPALWLIPSLQWKTLPLIFCLLSEYEILSTTQGESGVEQSVVTTNQTHTAVENLKPESKCVSAGAALLFSHLTLYLCVNTVRSHLMWILRAKCQNSC